MTPILILYRDCKKQRRWRLKAANGNILADSSQGFTTAASRNKNLKAVAKAFGVVLYNKDFPPKDADWEIEISLAVVSLAKAGYLIIRNDDDK